MSFSRTGVRVGETSRIALLAMGALFVSLATQPSTSGWKPSALLAAIGIISLARIAYPPKLHFPVAFASFYLFQFVFIALAGLVQLQTRTFPMPLGYSYPTPSNLTNAGIIGLASVGAFEIGYRFKRTMRAAEQHQSVSITRARQFLWALNIATAAGAVYVLSKGGTEAFTSSWTRFAELVLGEVGPLYGIKLALLRCPGAASGIVYAKLRRDGIRLHSPLLAAASMVSFLISVLPTVHSRFWVLSMVLALLLVSLRRTSVLRLRFAFVAGAVMLVAVVPALDFFRHETSVSAGRQKLDTLSDLASDGDFSQYQQISNAVSYVEGAGHSFGRQFAGTVLVAVPRSVWRSKPEEAGRVVANLERGNPSASLPVELFLDFGWVGVLMAGVGLGVFAYSVDVRLVARSTQSFPSIPAVLAATSLLAYRGTFQTFVLAIVPLILLLWLFDRYCTVARVASPATAPGEARAQRPSSLPDRIDWA